MLRLKMELSHILTLSTNLMRALGIMEPPEMGWTIRTLRQEQRVVGMNTRMDIMTQMVMA